MMRWLLIFCSLPTVAAFAVMLFSPYSLRVEALSILAYGLQINPEGDVWLEKRVGEDGWEKVALIFGWGDNGNSCGNLRAAFKTAFPDEEYRCRPTRH